MNNPYVVFHKTAYFSADNSFWVLFCIFVLKLKFHLCNDAISLTSLVSSSEFNCLHKPYIFLRSANASSIQILILFIWPDKCNPQIPLHDPNKIHNSP